MSNLQKPDRATIAARQKAATSNNKISTAKANIHAALDEFLSEIQPKDRAAANYGEHNQAYLALADKIGVFKKEIHDFTQKMHLIIP